MTPILQHRRNFAYFLRNNLIHVRAPSNDSRAKAWIQNSPRGINRALQKRRFKISTWSRSELQVYCISSSQRGEKKSHNVCEKNEYEWNDGWEIVLAEPIPETIAASIGVAAIFAGSHTSEFGIAGYQRNHDRRQTAHDRAARDELHRKNIHRRKLK